MTSLASRRAARASRAEPSTVASSSKDVATVLVVTAVDRGGCEVAEEVLHL